MVNPNLVTAIYSVAASVIVVAVTGLFRAVANGFKEMKAHLNRQDQALTSVSERVATIEGNLRNRPGSGN